MGNSTYIGRFAPSPSGPLHLGSLMSATCSYLQAKSNDGQWLIRIEDVDTPRVIKGASNFQLNQLANFGFEWDGPVLYQSSRFKHYEELIQLLIKGNKIYACECTRKQLKEAANASKIGFIYPKNCINKSLNINTHSLRFKTDDKEIYFDDKVYGVQTFNIQNLSSDWVIKRVDNIFAYHLAVVADDDFQGITEVVRGFDILPLTPLHISLQNELKMVSPTYLHHPLILQNGNKLSKQNHAFAVDQHDKIATLEIVLQALGQKNVNETNLSEFWVKAIQQWDHHLIPKNHFNI